MLATLENSIRVRPISSELSILGNCDGSARVKQGNSSVMVGIWGPVEVKQSKEDPEKCVIETTVKAATGQGSPLDKMYEEAVRQTCEQIIITSAHPRTCIQVCGCFFECSNVPRQLQYYLSISRFKFYF